MAWGNQQPHDETGLHVLTTNASNMADAITYLIRAARHAGMRRIATKLGNVRSELLILAAEEIGETDPDPIAAAPPDHS